VVDGPLVAFVGAVVLAVPPVFAVVAVAAALVGRDGVGWTAVVPVPGRSTTQPTTISASTATMRPTTISGPDGDDFCGGGVKRGVPYGFGGWYGGAPNAFWPYGACAEFCP
jgi:hypothetical protein